MTGLTPSEAFVQVNTLRGFRYLDDAGKIMNRWDEEFPTKNVGLDGLIMSNDERTLRQIRVTMDRIWVHFFSPKDATFVAKQGSAVATEICRIIDVKQCSRIGMRLQYAKPLESLREAIDALAPAFFAADWQQRIRTGTDNRLLQVVLGLQDGDMRIVFRASPAELNPKLAQASVVTWSKYSALFDFDIYTDKRTDVNELANFLSQSARWISEHLEEYVGASFREVSK